MVKTANRIMLLNAMRRADYKGLLSSNAANKLVEETEMHSIFVVNGDSMSYDFSDDDRPERIIKSFFSAVSAYLSKQKVTSEDEATALVLQDPTGAFKFAAIVEYHANETDGSEPGNWSYVWTFNESDVTDLEKEKNVKKLLCSSTAFGTVFDKVAYDIASIQFEQDHFMYDACCLVIDTILQMLDAEAVAGETVDIEMPGYFVASVAVEGDEKIFSITPDGHQKTIIKDDGALEV